MERQSAEKNNQGKYFHIIRHSGNFKGNGYKLSSRRFLGSFGWTSVSYDWSMVVKANINQSEITLVHLTVPEIVSSTACTHDVSFTFSGVGNCCSDKQW